METLEVNGQTTSVVNPTNTRVVETNPLQIGQILGHLFDFLDNPKQLKELRLVCQLWDAEVTRTLFKNGHIVIRPPTCFVETNQNSKKSSRKDSEMEALQNLIGHSKSNYDVISLRLQDPLRDSQIFQSIPLLRDKVSRLDFDCPNAQILETNGVMEQLANCLEILPNLKILKTTYLDLSPDQSWLKQSNKPTNETEEDDDPMVNLKKLDNLVKKLSSLKEIDLNFWLNMSTLTTLLNFCDKLINVRFLKIDNGEVLNVFADEIGGSWNVQSVHLSLFNDIPVEVVRLFLRGISFSLRHLSLKFSYGRWHHGGSGQVQKIGWEMADRFCISSPIPWTLNKLNKLEIETDDPRLEATVWKTFGVAMELPHLKFFSIKCDSISTAFDDMIRTWVRSRGCPFKSFSLERLTIWPRRSVSSPTIFGCRSFWPNLKSLAVHIDIDCGEEKVVADIFSELFRLSGLDRLELFLMDCHQDEDGVQKSFLSRLNFDELLTGFNDSRKLDGWSSEEVQAGEEKSIKNLKTLKSLKIECSNSCCQFHRWSDSVIYEGIIHLKNLQSLEISDNFISSEAINALKKERGPNFHISLCH